jgi:hypothetical protein
MIAGPPLNCAAEALNGEHTTDVMKSLPFRGTKELFCANGRWLHNPQCWTKQHGFTS